MSEEFTLNEIIRYGSTINSNHRSFLAGAEQVDVSGDQFLAGAVLAGDEYTALTRCGPGHLLLEVADRGAGAQDLDGGPWQVIEKDGHKVIIKDVIADAMLQQILTRPAEYSVIATLNLNGDYISDALAAIVGGIGIAPGANINYETGHAIFEATHGTAPKYAGQDKVNPGSVILSGAMMLEHLGWQEAADLIYKGLSAAISSKRVTYDFERLMEGATLLKCSEFGDAIIQHMG